MAHEAGASLGWGSLAVELPLLFSTTAAWEPSQLQLAALLSLCCLVAFYSLRHYSDAQGKRVAAAGPEVSSGEVKTPFASLSERTESFKAAFQSALNYPWAMIENPVSFAFVESEQNRTLVEAVKACGAYAPTPWVVSSIGGHIQSAMFAMWCPPKVWRQTGKMTCKKDLVKSSRDGGAFGVVWWDASAAGAPLPSTAPVVIMLPGVVGKPDNIYLKRMALHLAHRYGWRTAVKGWRGLGTELTTPRPETWDDTALQDLLDAIAYVRGTIGPGVPMFGVGFSFGGALLTTAVGTVPRAVHTLSAVVSVSGLFDFGSMLKHVETQWGWLYDAMNAKVTVANYKRFKVLDVVCTPARSPDTDATTSAHAAAAAESFGVDAGAAMALPEEQRRQQQQQRADAAAAAANTVAAAADDTSHTVLASGTVTPAGGDAGSDAAAAAAAGERDAAAAVAAAVAAAAAAAPAAKLQSDGSSDDDNASEVEEVVTINSLGDIGGSSSAAYSSSSRSAGPTVTVIGGGGSSGGSGSGGAAVAVKMIPALEESELAAIKGHRDFHSIFTVPFSGDASVDDYIVRVERMHAVGRARVNVPVLALLAEDDPLCPPASWVDSLKSAATNENIIVAQTRSGGHCGWFTGMAGDSWLDEAASRFLAAALSAETASKQAGGSGGARRSRVGSSGSERAARSVSGGGSSSGGSSGGSSSGGSSGGGSGGAGDARGRDASSSSAGSDITAVSSSSGGGSGSGSAAGAELRTA